MNSWSIDKRSGHCHHSSGLDAYYDSSKIHEHELPTIGPFGTRDIEPALFLSLVEELEFLYEDRFVVSGTLDVESQFTREVAILGLYEHWTPRYSTRSLLIKSLNASTYLISREWTVISPDVIFHKSGQYFDLSNTYAITVGPFATDIPSEFMFAARDSYAALTNSNDHYACE